MRGREFSMSSTETIDPQVKILQDARENLFNAVTDAADEYKLISALEEAAGLASPVFKDMPYTAGAIVIMFAEIAQAIREGEVLSNDVPQKVAYEILAAHEALTAD